MYYIGTKKENEIGKEAIVKSFDTKEELIQYYKDVMNDFDHVRFGENIHNWIYWREWLKIKRYPFNVMENYIMRGCW